MTTATIKNSSRVRCKLHNSKVTYNGITFDSKMERDYYVYLLGLQKQGIVREIALQPKFELLPKFTRNGKHYRAITYTPDFAVLYTDGRLECIDVKGISTQQGEMRRKLFLYRYDDICLRWVTASKKYSPTGWIDYDELQKLRREARKARKN